MLFVLILTWIGMYLPVLIKLTLVAAFAASVFADLLSRLWRRGGHRPAWIVGIIAILGAVPVSWLSSWFCMFHTGLLFPFSESTTGFGQSLVTIIAFLAVPIGILPA